MSIQNRIYLSKISGLPTLAQKQQAINEEEWSEWVRHSWKRILGRVWRGDPIGKDAPDLLPVAIPHIPVVAWGVEYIDADCNMWLREDAFEGGVDGPSPEEVMRRQADGEEVEVVKDVPYNTWSRFNWYDHITKKWYLLPRFARRPIRPYSPNIGDNGDGDEGGDAPAPGGNGAPQP